MPDELAAFVRQMLDPHGERTAPAGLYWPGADDEPRQSVGLGGPDPRRRRATARAGDRAGRRDASGPGPSQARVHTMLGMSRPYATHLARPTPRGRDRAARRRPRPGRREARRRPGGGRRAGAADRGVRRADHGAARAVAPHPPADAVCPLAPVVALRGGVSARCARPCRPRTLPVHDACGMRFRRRRDRREAELSLRPISNWMLLLAVVAVAVAGGGLTWWLLSIGRPIPATASVQIDAIRTGLSALSQPGERSPCCWRSGGSGPPRSAPCTRSPTPPSGG